MLAKTDNASEAYHRGFSDRVPPTKDNLNEYILALLNESIRQSNKFVQAESGIKKYSINKKQHRHLEQVAYKCQQWEALKDHSIQHFKLFTLLIEIPILLNIQKRNPEPFIG